MSAMASVPGALGEVWAIGDCKEPPGPRDDGAGSAFVLSVVHREVRINVAKISPMSLRIYMSLTVKTAVAVAVSEW